MKRNKNKIYILFLIGALFLIPFFVHAESAKQILAGKVKDAFDWGIGIASSLAVIVFAIGAAQYVFSADNPTTKNSAKEKMISAIVGMALLLTSFLIMKTINPEIVKLGVGQLSATEGIYYTTGDVSKDVNADMQNADASDILKLGYKNIRYSCVGNKGTPIVIWYYPEKDFKDTSFNNNKTVVKIVNCGKSEAIDQGKSHKISFLFPGVYFYTKAGCTGLMSEGFTNDQSPIPEIFRGKVKSVRIVDGQNQNSNSSGNFVGNSFKLIFHGTKSANASGICSDIMYSTYNKAGDCIEIGNNIPTISATIINFNNQGVARGNLYNKNGLAHPGQGVSLYSKPWGWQAGSFSGEYNGTIQTSTDEDNYFIGVNRQIKGAKAIFAYKDPNCSDHTCEPQKYQTKCKTFTDCPGAISLNGRFLVVVSTYNDYGNGGATYTASQTSTCQVFYSSVNVFKETEFSAQGNKVGSISQFPIR